MMYRLEVYSVGDYAAVRKMLMDYINYAPEYSTQCTETNDIQYFDESFSEITPGSIAYILRNGAGTVEAFMTCEKWKAATGESGWYVKNMFVRQSDESAEVAKQMIDLFFKTVSSNEFLCVNVNAQCKDIISLWLQWGLRISPDRTIFRNADNETLVALARLH